MVQLIIIMRLCNNINYFYFIIIIYVIFLFDFFLFIFKNTSIIIILSLLMYLIYQLLLRTSYLYHSYMQIITMNILLFVTFFHLRMVKMIYFFLPVPIRNEHLLMKGANLDVKDKVSV